MAVLRLRWLQESEDHCHELIDVEGSLRRVNASTRRRVNALTRRRVDASTSRRVDATTRRRVNASTRPRVDASMRRWLCVAKRQAKN